MKQASARCPVVFADGMRCTRPVRLNGRCHPCNSWSRRHGGADPNGRRAYPKRSREEVVAAALAIPLDVNGCRISRGTFRSDAQGYPVVKLNRQFRRVTRIVLEDKLGRPLRPGMLACHRCDTPACVSPGCLWEGDAADNSHDSLAKGRKPSGAVASRSKPNRKIEDVDVPRIRSLVAGGMSQKAVAGMYGVHPSKISRIVNRKRRAWVQ